MSGPDETEDDKGFLARWSQRKLEAKQPATKPATSAPENVESPPAPSSGEPEPEFDLSSLPKLEELTGSTDVTAFLRKGVPEHLRNAALQKSWALDPAIRNYVSPALDYAYDWNAPGGVPGGGELGAGVDVARMVSQIMGDPVAKTVKSDANAANESVGSLPQEHESLLKPQPEPLLQSVRGEEEATAAMDSTSNVEEAADARAPLVEADQTKTVASQQPVRRHGTAKPIV
jgi:hypothetical protein